MIVAVGNIMITRFLTFYESYRMKGNHPMNQPIDQVKTGIKLKMLLKAAGYDVKYIQEYLH